jgi:hypothetical protein
MRPRIVFQQIPRVLEQLFARLREIDALAQSFHERRFEASFQLLNLMRDRGLAQIEFRSRAREAAALHDFDKRPELIEIEAAHSL